MKEFTKGTLVTVVDDNDRRIADYLANGWKERPLTLKPQDDADKRIGEAIEAADESESAKGGKVMNKSKQTAANKKINDAVSATAVAVAESEEIDDGLLNRGGADNG